MKNVFKISIFVGVCLSMCASLAFAQDKNQEPECAAALVEKVVKTKALVKAYKNMKGACRIYRSCKMACRTNVANCFAQKTPSKRCKQWMHKKCVDVCKKEEDNKECTEARATFWAVSEASTTDNVAKSCKKEFRQTKSKKSKSKTK